MAITWTPEITTLDVERKEISITANYINEDNPENVRTGTCVVLSALIQTPQQKIDVMDNIYEQYQEAMARQNQIDAFVGNLEQQAKDNLEARE